VSVYFIYLVVAHLPSLVVTRYIVWCKTIARGGKCNCGTPG